MATTTTAAAAPRRRARPRSRLPTTLAAALLAAGAATVAAQQQSPFAPETFECDVPRETRAIISLRALEILRRNGFEHVETGFYASHVRGRGRICIHVHLVDGLVHVCMRVDQQLIDRVFPSKNTGAQGRRDCGGKSQHALRVCGSWLRLEEKMRQLASK